MKWVIDEFIKDWPWILGITIVVATWLTYLDIRSRKKLEDKIIKKIQKKISEGEIKMNKYKEAYYDLKKDLIYGTVETICLKVHEYICENSVLLSQLDSSKINLFIAKLRNDLTMEFGEMGRRKP